MKLLNYYRSHLKKIGLLIFCLGFLSFMWQPGQALAAVLAAPHGTAYLDWASATWDGYSSLSWLDADSVDTRSSHSSAEVTLNLAFSDPGDSDAVEGGFTNTSVSPSLSESASTATGTAYTDPAEKIYAESSISLNDGPGFTASVLSEATFSGQFTVVAPVSMNLTVPYHISLTAPADGALGYAEVDGLVELNLFNFDTATYLTDDFRWPANSNFDTLYTEAGNLNLVWDLVPGITYDFSAASASTYAYAETFGAPVPIPGTFLLFGSGLFGLVSLRKNYRKLSNGDSK